MQSLKVFDDDNRSHLDDIGGEPLADSGFESELPEPGRGGPERGGMTVWQPPPPTPGRHPTIAAKPRDFRQEVTPDRIIGMLSSVAPWQKPWNPGEGSLGMPKEIRPPTETIVAAMRCT